MGEDRMGENTWIQVEEQQREYKSFLTLEKITVYNSALDFSNMVWSIVTSWGYFERDTVGKQFVRATDSISANIAEGFGRYNKKDKIRFYRISMGSLEEVMDWVNKSWARQLISKSDFDNMQSQVGQIRKDLYHLIKFTNDRLKY